MYRTLFLGLLAAAEAHFVLQIPTSLGYDDANEATGPCDNFDPTNRNTVTDWPVGGSSIGLLSTHPVVTWEINVALLGSDSLNWVSLVQNFDQTAGVGEVCFAGIPGFETWIDKPVVLQLKQHAPDGILYQCAAIQFVAGGASPTPADCTNTSGVKVNPIIPAPPPGGSSSTSTPPSSTETSTTTGATSTSNRESSTTPSSGSSSSTTIPPTTATATPSTTSSPSSPFSTSSKPSAASSPSSSTRKPSHSRRLTESCTGPGSTTKSSGGTGGSSTSLASSGTGGASKTAIGTTKPSGTSGSGTSSSSLSTPSSVVTAGAGILQVQLAVVGGGVLAAALAL
ncbi:hypothetical protein GQ53DRAFT_44584 [Thozetella sp. PMI_491]|nr:hypothetical protein GQ53DRAFT_44584 [Thozetella sp. PMI_491]